LRRTSENWRFPVTNTTHVGHCRKGKMRQELGGEQRAARQCALRIGHEGAARGNLLKPVSNCGQQHAGGFGQVVIEHRHCPPGIAFQDRLHDGATLGRPVAPWLDADSAARDWQAAHRCAAAAANRMAARPEQRLPLRRLRAPPASTDSPIGVSYTAFRNFRFGLTNWEMLGHPVGRPNRL